MSSSPAKPVIYVVDDDPGVLGSLRFLLETDGFDVKTFRSGAALLNAAASNSADCFVIDYKMPNMNGIDLVNRLRNRDIAAPIILITGYPDDNYTGEGRCCRRARRPAEAPSRRKPCFPYSGCHSGSRPSPSR